MPGKRRSDRRRGGGPPSSQFQDGPVPQSPPPPSSPSPMTFKRIVCVPWCLPVDLNYPRANGPPNWDYNPANSQGPYPEIPWRHNYREPNEWNLPLDSSLRAFGPNGGDLPGNDGFPDVTSYVGNDGGFAGGGFADGGGGFADGGGGFADGGGGFADGGGGFADGGGGFADGGGGFADNGRGRGRGGFKPRGRKGGNKRRY